MQMVVEDALAAAALDGNGPAARNVDHPHARQRNGDALKYLSCRTGSIPRVTRAT
jgi:hypothetical protein